MSRVSILNFLPNMTASKSVETADSINTCAALTRNFESSGRGWFWSTNERGELTYLSAAMANHVGKPPGKLLGTPIIDLFSSSAQDSAVRERLPFVLNRQANFEKLILQSSGARERCWWEVSGRAQFGASKNFIGYLGFGIDVTDQLRSSESASQLALYDALTGLPNRLSMSRSLETHLAGMGVTGRSCAVILIDLDRFKAVNDSLGHPAGDELLKQVSNRLLRIIKDKEKIFRLGGDEFQVILPNRSDRDELGKLADTIIASISQPYSIAGSRCVIGASLGLAVGPTDGLTGEELMRNADLALYAAKESGRGCHRFFSSAFLQVAEDRRALEDDLRDALGRDELSLNYQPIVCANSNNVTGVEALIRWTHPTRGTVSPALFIPIAEDANLIDSLGEWIIRKACEDAADWPVNIRVAVNVSPIQFANEGLPAIVTSALANSGLAPDRLELELTEGIFLNETNETDTMFKTLKSLGVRLALDDFGTGYSSLGYLKTAPFDKIKIDQSFVRGATLPGSRNGAIIAAIVALAGALDMETTAEGIESFDQLDLMRSLGVSHIQGYVYSKAVRASYLSERLAAGEWMLPPAGPSRQRLERRSVYRKAGVILDGHYYPVIIRNLSESGAFIEGLTAVAVGTKIVLDFGDCQLIVATVQRIQRRGHGIEFVKHLVDDGSGGLCTSEKVAPYLLAKLGLSRSGQLSAARALDAPGASSVEALALSLGLLMSPNIGSADVARAESGEGDGQTSGSDSAHQRVQKIFAATNPLQSMLLLNPGKSGNRHLSTEEWERLKAAVEESHNTVLKYMIALIVLTGVRFQELLAARWDDINSAERIWMVQSPETGKSRQVILPAEAVLMLRQMPRMDGCDHVFVNPRTKKPFNTIFGSWDAARKKAGLDSLSIHDLRNSIKRTWQFSED